MTFASLVSTHDLLVLQLSALSAWPAMPKSWRLWWCDGMRLQGFRLVHWPLVLVCARNIEQLVWLCSTEHWFCNYRSRWSANRFFFLSLFPLSPKPNSITSAMIITVTWCQEEKNNLVHLDLVVICCSLFLVWGKTPVSCLFFSPSKRSRSLCVKIHPWFQVFFNLFFYFCVLWKELKQKLELTNWLFSFVLADRTNVSINK